MKRLLNLAIFSIISTIALSQTTLEEYNYLTKGYKIQIESGLDMKKGYELKDAMTTVIRHNSYSRIVKFKYLYRIGEKYPCATLMIMERSSTNYQQYICIPSKNSSGSIWSKAQKDFYVATNDWTTPSQNYTWGMVKMIAEQASYIDKSKLRPATGPRPTPKVVIAKTQPQPRPAPVAKPMAKIKYLFADNGGILTFFADGTYSECSGCSYVANRSNTQATTNYKGKYEEFPGYIRLESGTVIEYFRDNELRVEWKIFAYEQK